MRTLHRNAVVRFGAIGMLEVVALVLIIVALWVGVSPAYGESGFENHFSEIPKRGEDSDKTIVDEDIRTYDWVGGVGDLIPSGGETHFDCDQTIYYYFEYSDVTNSGGQSIATFEYSIQYRPAGGSWATYFSFDDYYTGPWYPGIAAWGSFWFDDSACQFVQCTNYEWRVKLVVEDQYGTRDSDTSYSPTFYLHDQFDPVAALPITPLGSSEANLVGGNLTVRMSATDNAKATGLRLRYTLNGGSYQYIPSSTGWLAVSGTSVSQDVSVPVPLPYEGVSVVLRTYVRDCEGLEDASSTVSLSIGDSDTTPPSFSNCHAEEAPGGDGDGIIEDNESIRVMATITDPSGVSSASVLFDGFPYTGILNGSTYYRDFAAGSFTLGLNTVTITAEDSDSPSPSSGTCPADFSVLAQSYDVTFASVPESVPTLFDGVEHATTFVVNWLGGSIHTVEYSPWHQTGPGTAVAFDNWSDGDANSSRSITVTGEAYYSASYHYQYELTVSTSPVDVTPISGSGWLNHGDNISVGAPLSVSGYIFDHFELDGVPISGNPVFVQMFAPHDLVAFYVAVAAVTVETVPIVSEITVDGVVSAPPQTFQWAIGSTHNIEATTPFGEDSGARWVFDSWSNGGTNALAYTANLTETLTCTYTEEFFLAVATAPAGVAPIGGEGWYESGTPASVTAPATAGGLTFLGWLVDGVDAGSSLMLSILMDAPHVLVAQYGSLVDVACDPDTVSVEVPSGGSTEFVISINVQDVVDLYGFEVDVAFETQFMDVVAVTEGTFLGADGGSTFWLPPTIDEANGTIQNIGASRLTAGVGVSGSGPIIDIRFIVLGDPLPGSEISVDLLANGLILSDPAAQSIPIGNLSGTTVLVSSSNPVPTLVSLTPGSIVAGTGDFVLTVNGANYVESSVVQWDDTSLETTPVNGGELTAAIPGSKILSAGTASVTVLNPVPGGGISEALVFTIEPPAPDLSTYYVSTVGSDANPGTFLLPMLTIQHAIGVASVNDTISIFDGVFTGQGNRDIDFGGKDLVVRSINNDPSVCIIDCGGTLADPHIAFHFHSGETSASVVEGIGVVGAVASPTMQAAIYVEGDNSASVYPPFSLASGSGASPTLRYLTVTNTDGAGFAALGGETSATIESCVFSGNSWMGAFVGDQSRSTSISASEFHNNGMDGLTYRSQDASATIEMCSFVGNGDNGVNAMNFYASASRYIDCTMQDNGMWGFTGRGGEALIGCQLINNGLSGPGFGGAEFPQEGGQLVANCTVKGNQGTGLSLHTGDSATVRDCEVLENTESGIISTNYDRTTILRTLVAGNGQDGIVASSIAFSVALDSVTVAGNGGIGIEAVASAGTVSLNSVLIVGNGGCPLSESTDPGAASWQISCTNIFGHSCGDWVAPFDRFVATNNNDSFDPRFCDQAGGDYHLEANSACAGENNPDCGQIGALGIGCGIQIDECAVLQDYDSNTGAIISSRRGEQVTVQGVVYLPPATFSQTSGGYLYDETGGINFWSSPTVTTLSEGDVIQLNGVLSSDSGELYIDNYTYELIGTNQLAVPVVHTITGLFSDYDNVGNFVRIPGTITSIGASSLWLSDGTNQIEILLNAYAGLTSAGLSVGMTGSVQGPCTILGGTMNVKPRRLSDMDFPAGNWFNLTTGDLIDTTPSVGVSWSDYDSDGDEDLLVMRSGNTPRLYENNGFGGFIDNTPTCIGSIVGPGASWGDYNHDHRPDLFLADFGSPAKILENTGSGNFNCITLGEIGDNNSNPYPGVWVDYNLDGVLDLAIANYDDSGTGSGMEIFDGALNFQEATPLSLQLNGRYQSMHWADMDSDGDLDVLAATEDGFAYGFENSGGVFTRRLVGDKVSSQGIDVGDFNNDGLPDVFVTHWGNGDELIVNRGDWVFEVLDSAGILPGDFGQSCVWGDYDNDGWLDVFVARYNADDVMYHNNGDETFEPIFDPILTGLQNSNGAACADVDGDGDLDLYVASEANQDGLFRNDWAPAVNNWVKVRLTDTYERANATALGARVVLYAGGQMMTRHISGGNGMNSQNSQVVHFGLGQTSAIDSVLIYWPSITAGTPLQIDRDVAINTTHEYGLDNVVDIPDVVGTQYVLYEAVPNPFNPMTKIAFDLPSSSFVKLRVFDVSGRVLTTIVSGSLGQGYHEYSWQGTDKYGYTVSAGVYFYRLEANGFADTKRMTLVK